VSDYRDAWVWQLGSMLAAKMETKVEVLNAGIPYATTAENLADYVFRYRYLHPDLVVIESGGNDQMVTWYPDYNPEYTHFRAQGTWWEPPKKKSFILRSNIAKVVFTRWLNSHLQLVSMDPSPPALLDRQEVLQRVRTNHLEGFQRNLDLVVKLAKNDGCSVLLVGFLQARKENLTRNRPEFRGLEQAWEEGLVRHLAVMKNVAATNGVPLVIPLQEKFSDEMFTDNCHLTKEGERIKAGQVQPALEALAESRRK